MPTLRAVLVVMLVGCGGGSSIPTDAGPPDGAPDGSPIDAPPDAPPDASTEPAITGVATSDGFTQVRQDSTAQLVISGVRLAGATSVVVGTTAATIDSATDTEIRATVVLEPGHLIGPASITIVAAAGTVTRPDAIEVTAYVVSPTAAGGGHGTYQSPLQLCELETELSFPGDTIQLLGGTHECGRILMMNTGVIIEGAPGQAAIVRGTASNGFGFDLAFGPSFTTTVRDLTFEEPLAGPSITLSEGKLVAQRIHTAGGIRVYTGSAMIEQLTFDGAGPGIEIVGSSTSGPGSGATVRQSTLRCSSGVGASVDSGAGEAAELALDSVVIEGCATGVVANHARLGGGGSALTIDGCELVDNLVGIQMLHTYATVSATTIRDDAATPRTTGTGIGVDSSQLVLDGGLITGQTDIGVAVSSPTFNHDGVDDATLTATGVEIVGGAVGLAFAGMDSHVYVRQSVIRDQTEAAVNVSAVDSVLDLGTGAGAAGNALSVTSGFAIDDHRMFNNTFYMYILASGITLNGVSFAGQTIDGPAELAPYYRMVSSDSGIQF